jgi:hypothetical protein
MVSRRARSADPEVLKHAALAKAHADAFAERSRGCGGRVLGPTDVTPNRAP